MFCKRCGAELRDDALVCEKCGAANGKSPMPQQPATKIKNDVCFDVISLIVAGLSVVTCLLGIFALPFTVIALVIDVAAIALASVAIGTRSRVNIWVAVVTLIATIVILIELIIRIVLLVL